MIMIQIMIGVESIILFSKNLSRWEVNIQCDLEYSVVFFHYETMHSRLILHRLLTPQ